MTALFYAALALLCVATGLLGASVLTNSAFRRKQIMRKVAERVEGTDRFVDIGVTLHTVAQDPKGEELIEGKPRLRIVRTRHFGGVMDTKSNPPRVVGPSRSPRVWFCSEDQEPVVLHANCDPLGQLVYGSEGAGKTTSLVQWTYLRWLEHLGEGREGGVTAPTSTRVELVLREFMSLFSPSWYRYASAAGILTLCDGTRIRLVSTYRQSKAQGSPVQGFNFSFAARDEGQDQTEVHDDIESRGRAAKNGRYKQLITATAKDDPQWRTLRDQLDAAKDKQGAPLWVRRTLFGRRSPFVPSSFWDAKRGTMSAREYARRVDAKDVGPERATYPVWSRDTNLITVPDVGWTDVTERELSMFAPNRALLVGHDPGSLFDVSILLRAYVDNRQLGAYQRGKTRPFWVVCGEVTTEQSTTEHHIAKLLERVREDHLNLLTHQGRPNPQGRQILVRADPAGNNDSRTDKSVYTQFANAGIHIKPAAYNAANDGHGRVPKDAGIELVNTLICAESGERRLFVARRADGAPVAQRLVAALETSERDSDGKAETQRKNEHDQSHWCAALRYALWAIERPRLKFNPREELA